MNIHEAIGDLSVQLEVKRILQENRQADALALGIEALKLIDLLRFDGSSYYPNLLPGETE